MSVRSSVQIGNIIRNAVVFNSKNWNKTIMNADSLLQSVERLFNLLHRRRIDYVLVGGVALLKYVEGRNTEDIDVIMALPALKALPEISILSQEMYFARGEFEGLQIDILLTQNPLFAKVQRDYVTPQCFVEQEIPTATVEGLLLLKLYALPSLYRQGNFVKVGIHENDIVTLLYYYQPVMEPLLEELAHHLSDGDLVEIKGIVAELEQRVERFRSGSRE